MSGLANRSVEDIAFDFNDFSCRGFDGEGADFVHNCGSTADSAKAYRWHSSIDTISDVREIVGVC